MMKSLSQSGFLAAAGALLLTCPGVQAQTIIPNADGTNTVVTPEGNVYTITGGTTSGDNLFHSFQEFGLSSGQTADFITNPAIQNVLGQITGGNVSVIDGQLQVSGSNANLFLINPAGVLMGPNAALNLGGSFVATTADGVMFGDDQLWQVGSSDYAGLVGNPTGYVFTQDQPGAIANTGNLAVRSGQSITLLGGQVLNAGTLSAPGGAVTVAAVPGENLVRVSQDNSLLSLELATLPENAPSQPMTPMVAADLPTLLTGAGGAIAQASGISVNPDGSVQLTGSSVTIASDPATSLVAGTVDVSNPAGQGGSVTLLGDQVGLVGANVLANGTTGGGNIRIGGDYLGQGSIFNASAIYIDDSTQVQASALTSGDGGRIIFWSDDTSRIYGDISARGGSTEGDGGFVETSSKGFLDVPNAPDVGAPVGEGGTWLLDPATIQIFSGSSTAPVDNSTQTGNVFGPASTAGTTFISDTTLNAGLATGNVIVRTSPVDLATTDGSIIFQDDQGNNIQFISGTLGDTLTFEAVGDILVNSPITSSGVNLIFQADSDTSGEGRVVVGNNISTFGGLISMTGRSVNGNGIEIQPSIFVENPGGDITLNGSSVNGNGVLIDGGLFSSNEGPSGNISITGLTTNASAFGILIDNGTVDTSGLADPQGSLTLTGNNSAGGTAIQVNTDLATRGGDLALTALNGDIEVVALDATNFFSQTPAGGNITVTASNGFFRATGFTLDAFNEANTDSSVLSDGGATITITHGGAGVTPFTVGDASTNGTAGRINNGVDSFDPTEAFFGPEDIRGNISILTTIPPEIPPEPPVIPPVIIEPTPPNLPECLVFCSEIEIPEPEVPDGGVVGDDGGDLVVDVSDSEEVAYGAWANDDQSMTAEFVDQLGLTEEDLATGDFNQAQAELLAAANATGIPPALIYVSFTPPISQVTEAKPQPFNNLLARLTKVNATDSAPSADAQKAQIIDPDAEQLELILVMPSGPPIRKTLPGVSRAEAEAMATRLRREVTDLTRLRTTSYLEPAQQLYSWLVAPLEADLQQQGIKNLTFIMEPGLRSLPIAALHNGEGFIIEDYSVGLMPSLSLTDITYEDLRSGAVLAMGASQFTDQSDLPAVPVELETVTRFAREREIVLNQDFTPNTLVQIRNERPFPIVHLATHGEFKAGDIDQSYIQFSNQRITLDQVRQLQLNNPPLDLLVLSACRMALGNREAELGFAGLAVKAGVKTAVASLWQVSDVGTAALMTEFYTYLQTAPIKAEALREAQLAMLHNDVRVQGDTLLWSDGEVSLPADVARFAPTNLSHPYYWSAFTLIGSPW